MTRNEFQSLKSTVEQLVHPRKESILFYFMGYREDELERKTEETRDDTISSAIYQIAQMHQDTFKAYNMGCQNKDNGSFDDFTELVSNYLFKTYSIDKKYNLWIEQIDHYAYLQNLNWVDSFYFLLDEIYNSHNFSIETVQLEHNLLFQKIEIDRSKTIDKLRINDDLEIETGDLIELSDLIGEDYKKTKFYDKSIRNPSWELFYPSDKDFKYIKFYHESREDNLSPITIGGVWRIFSRLQNTVLSIIERNGKKYIYTEIFEIEIEEALKEQEFIIIKNDKLPKNVDTIVSDFKDKVGYYRLGFVTKDEFLVDFPIYSLDHLDKNWHRYDTHFKITMGRTWMPRR